MKNVLIRFDNEFNRENWGEKEVPMWNRLVVEFEPVPMVGDFVHLTGFKNPLPVKRRVVSSNGTSTIVEIWL